MLSLNDLKLRKMTESDLEMVLNWRNSEHVRRYSLTDHIIKLEEHKKWYESIRNSHKCEWLIAELKNNPIGVVSITDINQQDSTCSWGLYVGELNQNLGMGILMEIRAIDYIFGHYGIRKIWGQVLESNRIILIHKKFGYVVEGVLRNHVLRKGKYEDILYIALFAQQWPAKRKELFAEYNLVDE